MNLSSREGFNVICSVIHLFPSSICFKVDLFELIEGILKIALSLFIEILVFLLHSNTIFKGILLLFMVI